MNILGESSKIKEVRELANKLAKRKITVLVTGETGTGKELIAQYIHNNSHRRNNNFIAVNCSSIPEGLLETELFGHEKGAFTGAINQKKGAFELADKGTLLLDEIGDMSLSLQSKILRTLESGEFRRVGGEKEIKVDVRIISCTNKDLAKEIINKNFRKDLYYRINVSHIHIPPLRERREDIPILIEKFIEYYNHKCNKNIKGISSDALKIIQNLKWEGNIRELRNFIESMISVLNTEYIMLEHISHIIKNNEINNLTTNLVHNPSFMNIIDKILNFQTKEGILKKVEREVIKEVLTKTHYNKTRSSRILGISLNSLKNKMKKYGISMSTIINDSML